MSFQDENYFLGIPKLPTRAMIFLVPFFLSFIMSGIVAFISTVKSLGMGMHIIPPWLTSWGDLLDDCFSHCFICLANRKTFFTVIGETCQI